MDPHEFCNWIQYGVPETTNESKTAKKKTLEEFKLCEHQSQFDFTLSNLHHYIYKPKKCIHSSSSSCQYLVKTNPPQQEKTTLYCITQNYINHSIPLITCLKEAKKTINPITKADAVQNSPGNPPLFTIHIPFCQSEKINAYPLIIGPEQSIAITLRMARILSNTTLRDPTQGPSHWRDQVIFHHMEHLKIKLDNDGYQYTDKELQNYVTSSDKWNCIPNLKKFQKLFMICFLVCWHPAATKWQRVVAKQGGGISCIDWSFKLFKWIRSMIDKLAHAKTKANLQATEEACNDHEYSKLLVCIFNVTNKYLFCSFAHLIPEAVEKHCYIVPILANIILRELLFCESHKRMNHYCLKSDGLTNNQDLHNKVFAFLIKYYGDIILNKFNNLQPDKYDFFNYTEYPFDTDKCSEIIKHYIQYVQSFDAAHCKRIHKSSESSDIKVEQENIAVNIEKVTLKTYTIPDAFHRAATMGGNKILAVGHGDAILCIHDRYCLNHKICGDKYAAIIDVDEYPIYEFLKKYADIFMSTKFLMKCIIQLCQASLKMRRTPTELAGRLRSYTFVDTVQSSSPNRDTTNMYDWVTEIIRGSLSRLPVAHWGYLLMMLCGWVTYEQIMHEDNRIREGYYIYKHKCGKQGFDCSKVKQCDIPKYTATFNVIKHICRMVDMKVPSKQEWSQNGFHCYEQWKGELSSFYLYVMCQFYTIHYNTNIYRIYSHDSGVFIPPKLTPTQTPVLYNSRYEAHKNRELNDEYCKAMYLESIYGNVVHSGQLGNENMNKIFKRFAVKEGHLGISLAYIRVTLMYIKWNELVFHFYNNADDPHRQYLKKKCEFSDDLWDEMQRLITEIGQWKVIQKRAEKTGFAVLWVQEDLFTDIMYSKAVRDQLHIHKDGSDDLEESTLWSPQILTQIIDFCRRNGIKRGKKKKKYVTAIQKKIFGESVNVPMKQFLHLLQMCGRTPPDL